MIRFESAENNKIQTIFKDDVEVRTIKMSSSTITNKFHIVTNFITNISKNVDGFDDWFVEYINEIWATPESVALVIEKNVDNIKHYVNSYIDGVDVVFDGFIDRSKVKKTSILFEGDEIKKITELSGYLKLYMIAYNSSEIHIDNRTHKDLYNKLATEIFQTEIPKKIFDVVKTKTFRYNLSDRYMWDYLKAIQCKTIDLHVIEIFNFITNSILVLCEVDKNPITYFVSVIEESVKWFLRSVYKPAVTYAESISTENIQSISSTNLNTYSYNDTLGRLKGIAYDSIYQTLEKEALRGTTLDDITVEFQHRCNQIKFTSPLSECLIFPILSKVLEIPYHHFKSISAEHASILSAHLHKCLKKVFKLEYKNLFALLDYFPDEEPSTATTYKIKQVHEFINTQNELNNFYGFKTKIEAHEILNFFIGRISRIHFINIYDGKQLIGIPLSKIESDMIKFYSNFFAGKFETEMNQISDLICSEF
jgi:hypothetical protein